MNFMKLWKALRQPLLSFSGNLGSDTSMDHLAEWHWHPQSHGKGSRDEEAIHGDQHRPSAIDEWIDNNIDFKPIRALTDVNRFSWLLNSGLRSEEQCETETVIPLPFFWMLLSIFRCSSAKSRLNVDKLHCSSSLKQFPRLTRSFVWLHCLSHWKWLCD